MTFAVPDRTTMEALVFDKKTGELRVVRKEIPDIAEREVLVRVEYAGVCGTDLHIIDGAFPCRDGPFSPGHEFCGVAVRVGARVTHVAPGDRVVVDPNRSCHVCHNCSGGLPQHCATGGLNSTIGIFKDGGWAQYCSAPDTQTYKLPHHISFETAALCEPVSCISHGWDRISPVAFGQRILVAGAGIIGSLWVSLLHLHGHKRVTVSEPNAKRLELVKRLGTGYECVAPDDLRTRRFDLVIDCSGSVRAIQQAFDLLLPNGKLCIFGVADPKQHIKISPFEIFKKELTIIGALINPFSFPKAMSFLEAMDERYLDYDKLGIKVFALSEHESAIRDLREGSIAKAVFKIN